MLELCCNVIRIVRIDQCLSVTDKLGQKRGMAQKGSLAFHRSLCRRDGMWRR